jgi:hypothetical protein
MWSLFPALSPKRKVEMFKTKRDRREGEEKGEEDGKAQKHKQSSLRFLVQFGAIIFLQPLLWRSDFKAKEGIFCK